jgi:hypothetical protein
MLNVDIDYHHARYQPLLDIFFVPLAYYLGPQKQSIVVKVEQVGRLGSHPNLKLPSEER